VTSETGAGTGPGTATAASGPRARLRTALAHREPDRIPFDLGATRSSGIHVAAYRAFRSAVGLPAVEPEIPDFNQQLARIDRDMLDLLGIDAVGVFPRTGAAYERVIADDGEFLSFRDEFGIGRRMLKDGGLFFDAYAHPLAGDIDASDVDRYPWPDATDPARYVGMAD
jgi:uroporphyrinogen decarboxylase